MTEAHEDFQAQIRAFIKEVILHERSEQAQVGTLQHGDGQQDKNHHQQDSS